MDRLQAPAHQAGRFRGRSRPRLILAQAIGRWGNYFNQELFGAPTNLPWALRIDPAHRPADTLDIALYHPTFLYESLWNVAIAVMLVWAERRFRLRNGNLFLVYVIGYTAGRGWIEALRVDHANSILGLRLNVWTSAIVFLAAAALLWFRLKRPNFERQTTTTAAALAPSAAAPNDLSDTPPPQDQDAGATVPTSAPFPARAQSPRDEIARSTCDEVI